MNRLLYIGVIMLIMAGCYPKGPTYVSDTDLVITNYSDTFNFGAQQTYYLFDTIINVDADADVSNQYDDAILSEIEENMNNLGYTQVTLTEDPDLILTTTVWSSTTTNFYYSGYDYWGWGYPGYGPGYGWGYPSYGWGYAYSSTYGSILMEMSYPDGINDQDQLIPIVWGGVINGLVQGNSSSVQDRITTNIDQAFEQSPYILSNP